MNLATRLHSKGAKVQRGVLDTPCMEWRGCTDKDGYGLVKVDGHCMRVHRVAYALYNQVALTVADDVDHRCLNRRCYAEDHLRTLPPPINRGEGSKRRWEAYQELRAKTQDQVVRE